MKEIWGGRRKSKRWEGNKKTQGRFACEASRKARWAEWAERMDLWALKVSVAVWMVMSVMNIASHTDSITYLVVNMMVMMMMMMIVTKTTMMTMS